jgi:MFS family permease
LHYKVSIKNKYNFEDKSYWLALLGRFIYGCGQESLIISQYTIIVGWFKEEEEARTAMGVIIATPRIGEALNSLLSPRFEEIGGSLNLPLIVALM